VVTPRQGAKKELAFRTIEISEYFRVKNMVKKKVLSGGDGQIKVPLGNGVSQ